MNRFILYGTLGCHLCELAEAQLAPVLEAMLLQARVIEIECIDIADDDALLLRYGERIPVLRRLRDNAELNWPFDDQAVYELLLG
ncbi:MAG TPA: glutaredoxin family protein [Spongiibacteraceae bacterium]|nr:glutaredoxin family protein [Spongiibacteraceae bacterium]